MRRIDADKLGEVKFHSLPYTHITPPDVEAESYKRGWNDAIDSIDSIIDSIIDNQPPIEPEIVRCKDCKFYSPMNKETKTGICNLTMHQNFGDDWFCAGAERRTDATD